MTKRFVGLAAIVLMVFLPLSQGIAAISSGVEFASENCDRVSGPPERPECTLRQVPDNSGSTRSYSGNPGFSAVTIHADGRARALRAPGITD